MSQHETEHPIVAQLFFVFSRTHPSGWRAAFFEHKRLTLNPRYYPSRAAEHAGLIISDGTVVERPGKLFMRDVPHLHAEPALAGWKGVIDAVNAQGRKMAPQLWHVRRAGAPATIRAFADAAANAKGLGFDAIEIHGAHTGDTLADRNRLAIEVLEAVRDAVGPEMVVILRLPQWRMGAFDAEVAKTPKQMEECLVPLATAGADILHMSQRRSWPAASLRPRPLRSCVLADQPSAGTLRVSRPSTPQPRRVSPLTA